MVRACALHVVRAGCRQITVPPLPPRPSPSHALPRHVTGTQPQVAGATHRQPRGPRAPDAYATETVASQLILPQFSADVRRLRSSAGHASSFCMHPVAIAVAVAIPCAEAVGPSVPLPFRWRSSKKAILLASELSLPRINAGVARILWLAARRARLRLLAERRAHWSRAARQPPLEWQRDAHQLAGNAKGTSSAFERR